MITLPHIMVAPNGAHHNKNDHPAIPITIEEISICAQKCYKAGAGAIHTHVRDKNGKHVLDVGLYNELIAEIHHKIPKMIVQITTEAVERYTPKEQQRIALNVKPQSVSVALREMERENETLKTLAHFYHQLHEKDIHVQHILYTPNEIKKLADFVKQNVIPKYNLSILFVLGKYEKQQCAKPQDILPFLRQLKIFNDHIDWSVCAFGKKESECLIHAVGKGGKIRIGFENNFINHNGIISTDNAERVREINFLCEKNKRNI